jgi:hypothetical protein
MSTVSYQIKKDIPVIAEADVLVIGGGPGGLGASVMAARAGAKVILVERYGVLGGMSAQGEVSPFMPNHLSRKNEEGIDKLYTLDRPVYTEWVSKMNTYYPPELRKVCEENVEAVAARVSKEISSLAIEDLCLEAGVQVIYHHTLADVRMDDDGHITEAIFLSKSGFVAIRAKAFVDSTGDGDLSVLAGAPSEFGGESGYCQPMTSCFKIKDIDIDRVPPKEELQKRYLEAKEKGEIKCPRENLLIFDSLDKDVRHFNTTRVVMKSAVNGMELSEAELEGHRQIKEIFKWFQRTIPGYENASLQSFASHIGVRESRRILGLNYITREDFMKAAKFDDAIARCNYMIDIHNPLGTGTEIIRMDRTDFYEIPFGCIVPRNVKNLTVGSRCISVDHALHSSCRVMPPVVSIGQAAGVAAAMSVQAGVDVCTLDGKEVRRKLVEMGANL